MPSQGEGRDYRARYVWILATALAAFAILAGRLYWLQVVRGEHYAVRSRSNFVKRVDLPADRGMILDRNGTILVDGRPSWDLELTPAFCPDVDGTLSRLAKGLRLDDEVVAALRDKVASARGLDRFKPVRLARDIPREAVDWVEAHALELDGVDVPIRPRRNYRYGTTLAHVLGYMNEIGRQELERSREEGLDYRLGDMVGREGLERRLESELRGADGVEQVAVDAKGRRIDTRLEEEPLIPEDERLRPSVPGHNVVLSIDVRLQQIAEAAFPGEAGAVVALDPETGYILAMVSRPAFDPNRMSGGITAKEMKALIEDPYEPMLHRAIQSHYPPGSTFKPVTALAGLTSGFVTPSKGTTCHGGYRLGRRRWRCWRAAGHGFENVYDALQHSCDTYFYWLGDKLGLDAIADMAHRFGLGRKTGIDLPHEVPGIIPTESWYDEVSPDGYQRGLALNASIGQGSVNVTPLQLAMTYATVANGGTVYKPQIVRRVEDADGHPLEEFQPEVTGRLDVDPADLAAVREGLRRVVMEPGGTAYWRRPKHLEFEMAGKTGTAQVVRMHGARVDSNDLEYWSRDHAWFAAFAPFDDPEIVVAVVNEHGGHGGSAAAPTAMAVIEGYFGLKAEDAQRRAMRVPSAAPAAPAAPGAKPGGLGLGASGAAPLFGSPSAPALAPGFETPPLGAATPHADAEPRG